MIRDREVLGSNSLVSTVFSLRQENYSALLILFAGNEKTLVIFIIRR